MFKVVFGLKDGKSLQKEVKEPDSDALLGKQIGDTINGESIGFTGYEFKITGGSDKAGFPMRKDVPGSLRKRILAIKGIGVNNKKKYRGKNMKGLRVMEGMRTRKTVMGNTISDKIVQINLKVMKEGPKPLDAAPEAEKAEAAPEEKKE